jgi:mannan endo-1,4-beta-mannosidase
MTGHVPRRIVLVGITLLAVLATVGAAQARPVGDGSVGTSPPGPGNADVSSQGKKRPPSNTSLPTIAGTAQIGQTLTATSGTWSGSAPITYAYQWLRCNSSGAGCANISGATATSYLLASADQGSTLRVSVRATNPYGSATAQSAATSVVGSAPPPPSGKQLYWGAWIGNQFTGTEAPWDMNAVADFESMVGKKLSLINFSSPWANCYSSPCTNYKFDSVAFNNVRNHGAIPFFSWGSDSLPFSKDEPDLSLGKIINGSWDSYVTSWATAAKNWGHPFFLRFNWEMNGNWFPWAEGVNGNTAGQYVQAWRHVHDIFASVGATNVSWVWCPNVDPNNTYTSLSSLYPGDSYVDWTCLDGYNWDSPWMSFDQLYKTTYSKIVSLAPSKPMAIGEMASTEKGGSKASWITTYLGEFPSLYPQIGAVLWFEKYDNGMDWPLETSSSATSAFAAGIGSPTYATNQFGSLSASPIPALS